MRGSLGSALRPVNLVEDMVEAGSVRRGDLWSLQLIDRVSIEVRAVGTRGGTEYRRCVENRKDRNSREALLKMLIGVDLAGRSEAWRSLIESLAMEKEVSKEPVEGLRRFVMGIDAVVASDD